MPRFVADSQVYVCTCKSELEQWSSGMIGKEGWDYVSCTYLHIPNEADLEFNQVFCFMSICTL